MSSPRDWRDDSAVGRDHRTAGRDQPDAERDMRAVEQDQPSGRLAFAEERRSRILELVQSRGRIRTSELAELLGVTEPTVRRDIADLDRQRLLRRTHGGALALRAPYEPGLAIRATLNVEAKRAIARTCVELIDDGDSVFLDSGSTVEAIAEALRATLIEAPPGSSVHPANATVLTNAVGIAALLADVPMVRHAVLGGRYRSLGGGFVGPLALESLKQFTLNTAFIGVSGLSEVGFTVSALDDSQLKAAVMDRARRVVVPMDSSKLGADDFCKVCDLDRVHILVTDMADNWLTRQCRRAAVELVVV